MSESNYRSNLGSFSTESWYQNLSVNDKAKFRAYKARYKKRGYNEDEAEIQAKGSLGLIDSDRNINATSSATAETCDIREIEGMGDVVFLGRRNTVADKISNKSSFDMVVVAEAVVSLLLAIGCSSVLIYSTSEAMGADVFSWIKAVLLELGLVFLATTKARGLSFVTNRAMALAAIFITIFLLHSVNKGKFEVASSPLAVANEKKQILLESKERKVEYLGSLGFDQPRTKRAVIKEIDDLDKALLDSPQIISPSVSTTEQTFNSDLSIRIFLVFLNIIAAHRFLILLQKMGNGSPFFRKNLI